MNHRDTWFWRVFLFCFSLLHVVLLPCFDCDWKLTVFFFFIYFRHWNASSFTGFSISVAWKWPWRCRSVKCRCQLCVECYLPAKFEAQSWISIQTDTCKRHTTPKHKTIFSRSIRIHWWVEVKKTPKISFGDNFLDEQFTVKNVNSKAMKHYEWIFCSRIASMTRQTNLAIKKKKMNFRGWNDKFCRTGKQARIYHLRYKRTQDRVVSHFGCILSKDYNSPLIFIVINLSR